MFNKIDVEGHEFEVLEGAGNTIQISTYLYRSLGNKGDVKKLINWCKQNKYKMETNPNDYRLYV